MSLCSYSLECCIAAFLTSIIGFPAVIATVSRLSLMVNKVMFMSTYSVSILADMSAFAGVVIYSALPARTGFKINRFENFFRIIVDRCNADIIGKEGALELFEELFI